MKVKNGKTFFIVLCLQLLCGFVGSNTTTVSECPDSHMRGDIRHGVGVTLQVPFCHIVIWARLFISELLLLAASGDRFSLWSCD